MDIEKRVNALKPSILVRPQQCMQPCELIKKIAKKSILLNDFTKKHSCSALKKIIQAKMNYVQDFS